MKLKKKPEWITYKDQELLYLNFREMNKDDIPLFMQDTKSILTSVEPNSVRFLVNVHRMGFDHATVRQFIEFSNFSRPSSLATAIVGIDSVKKVLYEAAVSLSGHHSKNVKMFLNNTNEEVAKDWLVSI